MACVYRRCREALSFVKDLSSLRVAEWARAEKMPQTQAVDVGTCDPGPPRLRRGEGVSLTPAALHRGGGQMWA